MTWEGWIWPLPKLNDRKPVISDGFSAVAVGGHRQHLGVDLMYRRLPSESAELPRGTKHFHMPANTPVIAAFGGKVWSAKVTSLGHSVSIDHGNVPGVGPTVTFYQHMASFAKPWKKGDTVSVGDRLGIVGGSLSGYPLHHLHFELWLPTRDHAVDPAPYMATWQMRSAPLNGGGLGTSYDVTTLDQDLRQVVESAKYKDAKRGGRGVSLPIVIGVGAAGLLAIGIMIASASRDERA